MTRSCPQSRDTLPALPPLPGWIGSASDETLEGAAFRSGAALAHLMLVAASADLPVALWRQRLALAAAETCAAIAGRREGQGALRDAAYLTRAGDDPGPAGRIFRQWSRVVARPISVTHLGRMLEGAASSRIALSLDASGSTPVDRAAQVIEAALADTSRAETAAFILADAVLSASIGLDHVLPLLSLALKPRDVARTGEDLRLACHRAVATGVRFAVPLAADLARRAARLRAVTPKLRAKGAARAVELFLTEDALTPVALANDVHSTLSDRAARRLCDRLVELGALRELTGRDSFRLYGL
ncbi:hypothetical protein GCM10010991_32230 [Gemmobacter aquaticus]|uniref:DUF1403 family protein n=1 Tax=Gemmobacter aquaticus TaxID=490185 RepID=A0A917YME5_9RHOB|nr:DUF1403 family protein [Gemmobacter aquaticus]GGO37117.1 hypothetical protein GCM10010991_32230 [Gemmobacter aquaticus]